MRQNRVSPATDVALPDLRQGAGRDADLARGIPPRHLGGHEGGAQLQVRTKGRLAAGRGSGA